MLSLVRLALLLAVTSTLHGQDWRPPSPDNLVPSARTDGPLLACTAPELARLRASLQAGEPIVRSRVDRARARLGEPVHFPPRGGQHNQWYQCDRCQLALVTVDDTHHRCPKCSTVYSGPPYDDVVFSQRHSQNLARALDAAWAFALTDEAPFAAEARTILLGYADRYEQYPYHSNNRNPARRLDSGGHIKEQTLSEAGMFVGQIAPAIDLVWPSLVPDERARLLDHLVRPLLKNIDKCKRGKSNWQSWHNAALCAGGLLLGEADWLQRAVLDPKNGFVFQMGACVSAEGMWYENSFGYHLYTLDALVHLAEAVRRTGVDLFAQPALRRMCSLPSRYLMADGLLPRLGDDVGTSPDRAARALLTSWAATRDPVLIAALPTRSSWESIRFGIDVRASRAAAPLPSELFRDAGHAILRSGGPAHLSALLTFAPFGGFHGHFDKLSFVWHAFGSERGIDPGRAASQAYRLPIHEHWYRATLAHNTVVVDGLSQRGAGGELLGFVTGEAFTAVAARTTTAYPRVDHRRCLVLTDRYLVVLDVLVGRKVHSFDWLYHDHARQAVTAAATDRDGPALALEGEEFVQWERRGATEQALTVDFPAGPVTTRLLVAGGSPTQVRTGNGPFRSAVDRIPFVLLRRGGTTARFAAVLTASTSASPSDVTGIRCTNDGDGLTVLVERGRDTDRIAWDGAGGITLAR